MIAGFDFDGTLACWPRGVRPRYDDPRVALYASAALLGPVRFARSLLDAGHRVVIVTGRQRAHDAALAEWSRVFLGDAVPIFTRPKGVGLSPAQQAAWKTTILDAEGLDVYVGDNPAIDKVAARGAGCRFIPATQTIQGWPRGP